MKYQLNFYSETENKDNCMLTSHIVLAALIASLKTLPLITSTLSPSPKEKEDWSF
jgi:hypothetical protein